MNILLLSTSYPSKTSPVGTTPVVHYFAKEWMRNGHQVQVCHISSAFPKIYYIIGRLFKNALDSRLGHLVPVEFPVEYEEEKDGVQIYHICIKKIKPHGRFKKQSLEKVFQKITNFISTKNVPDVFVGHWDNPQLELLYMLKSQYRRPTCLVFHDNKFEGLQRFYAPNFKSYIENVDILGFRNETAMKNFAKLYGEPQRSFICASGVSKPFIEAGKNNEKTFGGIKSYVYVGALIERKHPVEVVSALCESYKDAPFEMIFIGDGKEKNNILETFNNTKSGGELNFTGRIPRENIIEYLKKADVFVMISEGEIFGLVYLEAMALGCITIASRHEGIDGIIEDGVNGFLCDAGNTEELTGILDKIKSMEPAQLSEMSKEAKATAQRYSDKEVAENYIQALAK